MNNNNDSDCILQVTEKIVNTINEHGLADAGSSILVAVSGGADSVCLLHVLSRIRKGNRFKIYVAHLNHQIRGIEADADEEYVKSLCIKLNVKFFTKSVDVPSLAKKLKISEEEAGRKARYDFFSQITDEKKIDFIATAHNKNDQAETVLMRMIRGTGLSGLRGIKYIREDGVIRPLLDVTRQEIEQYCHDFKLKYKTDSTNSDNNYTRNKIRNIILPMLEKELNPNATEALANLAGALSEDADFIDSYTKRLYQRLSPPVMNGKFKAIHINSINLINSPAIISRIIILCSKDEMGDEYYLERKHVSAVMDMLDEDGGSLISLPKGLVVEKRYGWLEFKKAVKNNNKQEHQKELNLSNNKDFCIEVKFNKLYNIEEIEASISINLMNTDALNLMQGDIALDADILGVDLSNIASCKKKFFIRNRRSGDKFVIYKNGKSKKLKSLFIDMKIRREDRDRIPLLCDENDDILAVAGIRANEEYKITRFTKNVLVVRYEKYED